MVLVLRCATAEDIPHFERWDRQPHVISATTDDPRALAGFEDVSWSAELLSDDPASVFYVAELDGRPIGGMQVIDPALERTHYWGAQCPNGLRAMDIWIGETDCLGRGYGTQMMQLAIQSAFDEPGVEAIVVDPLASNTGAHRFYEKLGFQFVERRRFDDDDCFVFRLDRRNWRVSSALDS